MSVPQRGRGETGERALSLFLITAEAAGVGTAVPKIDRMKSLDNIKVKL